MGSRTNCVTKMCFSFYYWYHCINNIVIYLFLCWKFMWSWIFIRLDYMDYWRICFEAKEVKMACMWASIHKYISFYLGMYIKYLWKYILLLLSSNINVRWLVKSFERFSLLNLYLEDCFNIFKCTLGTWFFISL